jgi:hypothetical protein
MQLLLNVLVFNVWLSKWKEKKNKGLAFGSASAGGEGAGNNGGGARSEAADERQQSTILAIYPPGLLQAICKVAPEHACSCCQVLEGNWCLVLC